MLEHERYHVRARDPLKVVIARTLMSSFFYLPVLRPLLRRYTASREIAADRGALAVTGRAALAGALYRTVAVPAWANFGGAAALGGAELLDDRVHYLETGEEPSASPLSFLAIATTVAVLALLAGALLYTVVEAGGPTGLMRGRTDGDVEGMSSPSWTGAGVAAAPWLLAIAWVWRRTRRRRVEHLSRSR